MMQTVSPLAKPGKVEENMRYPEHCLNLKFQLVKLTTATGIKICNHPHGTPR
jgi:hypothetical protein